MSPFYPSERTELFHSLGSFTSFQSLGRDDQFSFIMSYNWGDIEVLTHVVKFVNTAQQSRKTFINGNIGPSSLVLHYVSVPISYLRGGGGSAFSGF